MTAAIAEIYRYPVKGLSGERLEQVELTAGQGLPHDRRFALAHGSTAFDPKNPQWLPKTNFLMLMRDEKLAQLRVRFDPEAETLTLERNGKQVVRAKATEPLGRTLINQFFAGFMAGSCRGTPKLVEAPGHAFFDTREKYLSIVNLASVRDFERVARRKVDPQRFRANLYLEGPGAWQEFSWSGRTVGIGDAELEIIGPIDRCAATCVDPATAARDLNVPLLLKQGFGHVDMGVYAVVRRGGRIAASNSLNLPQ